MSLYRITEKKRRDRQTQNLHNSSCFCVGCHTVYFSAPLRILLGDPGLPGFPRGRILTGEGDRGNLVIANVPRGRTVGGEHLKIGVGTVYLTVEEIPAEGFAGFQRHRHIAAIIERQLHRFCQLGERNRMKYAAFRRSGNATTMILGISHRGKYVTRQPSSVGHSPALLTVAIGV
jgi:hypothetical protein